MLHVKNSHIIVIRHWKSEYCGTFKISVYCATAATSLSTGIIYLMKSYAAEVEPHIFFNLDIMTII